MSQTIKNIVGGAVAVAVLAVGYAAVNAAYSYGKSIQPSSFRSFSVNGDGRATAAPDVAEFGFVVTTEGGKDIAALQAQNTDAMNRAIAFVKSEGVEDKDIKTTRYDLNPRYQTYECGPIVMMGSGSPAPSQSLSLSPSSLPVPSPKPCPPPSVVGYTVTQSVDVKIRDFKKIGDIMGGVVENGANQVGGPSFTIDDPSKLQDEARAKAIAKAKAKAEAIAKAGGFSIGRLLGIQEGYNPYPLYQNYGKGGGMAAMGSTSAVPVIQPGSQEVNVTVTLQYEIE